MTRTRLLTLGAAALAIGLAACGGDKGRDCAAGTVPDPNGANTCVPDGTVICGNGTTYDPNMGKCVAGGQCPQGEVLVNGTCTGDVHVDAEEGTEPNDTASAGTINVPAAGAPGFVIHGCITPRDDNATADLDPWTITVTGPTLLDVTAAGVGGLAAGFQVSPDAALADLDGNGWVRFGVNLTGTTSARQLFLPEAGTYTLTMADSRQLFLQEAVAGTDQTCYFTTITQLAIPSPTALTGDVADKIGGEVKFYTLTPGEGDLVDVADDMPSGAANASVVFVNNNAYQKSNEESSDPFTGAPVPAEVFVGGMKASDQLLIAVDTTYNYAIAPADFALTLTQVHAKALPVDGTVQTTEDAQFYTFLYFDVAHDGDILHFDLTFADDSALIIADSGLTPVATVASVNDTPIASFKDWVRFAKAGRYYVMEYHPSLNAGDQTSTTSKLIAATPDPVVIGTPLSMKTLNGTANSAWFTLDPASATWLKLAVSAMGAGGNVEMTFYPPDGVGRFDTEILSSFDPYTFNPNGSTAAGRITFGDTNTYIVRLASVAVPQATANVTLDVSTQTFTDLGTVTSTTGVDKTGESLGGAGTTKLYFVKATPGDIVNVTVHPATGFLPTLDQLDTSQASIQTGAVSGTDRTFSTTIGPAGWVAFSVGGTGTSTGYDVHVTAVTPKPYTVTTGAIAFSDACTGGQTITLTAVDPSSAPGNDEGLSAAQTLPFGFSMYGSSVSSFVISSNGWLAFAPVTDSAYANVSIPTAGEPDGFFAPYWDDFENVVVCKKIGVNTVTVQWTGNLYFDGTTKVQMQAIIHSNGVVDFVYGPNQAADGGSGTVGAESVTGALGNEVVYNTASSIAPNTSRTLTP
ncbi:MAG TPA: hypothetical protein VL463_35360 [Kofleriaceae bacterium]|nr:hypothetical protein [Kofleriaceae bacterium]